MKGLRSVAYEELIMQLRLHCLGRDTSMCLEEIGGSPQIP